MKDIRIGFLLLAVAVITGAFGAHWLKERLLPEQLNSWKTAVDYQFVHAIGLVILSILPVRFELREVRLRWAEGLMLAGIVLFSGSIYVLSTRELHHLPLNWIGPLTPLGGACFIASWILALTSLTGIKKQ